jgi:hypothetical protein
MPNSNNNDVLRRLDTLEKTLKHRIAELQEHLEAIAAKSVSENDSLLSTEEAARFLHVSYQTLLRNQNIPHTKEGKKRLYLHSDLIRWAKTRNRRGISVDEAIAHLERV